MFAKTVVALAALSVALGQSFTINTPSSAAECVPLQITWVGGTSPYTLSVNDGSTPAQVVEYLGSGLTGTSYTWGPVNLPSGLSVSLKITDNTGVSAQSAAFTIQAGTSSSCLNSTASTSGVATGSLTNTVTSSGTLSATQSTTGSTSTGAVVGGGSGSSMSSMSSSAARSSGSAMSGASSATSAAGSAASSAAAAATSKTGSAGAAYVAGVPALVGAAAVAVAALF